MTNPILRGSFTLFKLWASGNVEEAEKYYLKQDRKFTEAIEDGLKYHKDWAAYIKLTNNLPKIFGNTELGEPCLVEYKMVRRVGDWLTLVGVVDCYEDGVIHEFKTGVTDASTYGESYQAEVYTWLLTEEGHPVTKAMYHHYNQHSGEVDHCMVWMTPERYKEGIIWALKQAAEIHQHFIDNGIYDLIYTGGADEKLANE